jgi:BASS family bile acid:Na+ symporter
MTDILRTISLLSIILFAASIMLSAGLSFTFRAILAPLRDPNRVGRALVGNFVLVPLLAVTISYAFSLDPALDLGLILLGTAAGAPFLIKLVALAAADLALGTALLVLLVPMTVVFMPIAVPLLAPDTAVSPAAIAVPLALPMLVPLVAGLFVSELATRSARRLEPIARTISTITLGLLLVTTVLANLRGVGAILASPAAFAILAFVLGAFAIGYLIASPHPERRVVLGLGTGQRNVAAATVVATERFRGPDTLALVVVAAVLGMLVLIPIARWLRGRKLTTMPETELAAARV